ncbi:hypothetical protein B0H13DRAFT_2531082 [Mycena leptocephala]|nr:hypothetical protein B0H13DRAFT_2531082 [Mycena leptocephala]
MQNGLPHSEDHRSAPKKALPVRLPLAAPPLPITLQKKIEYSKRHSPPNPSCPGAGVPGYANTVSLRTGAMSYSSSSPLLPLTEGEEEGAPRGGEDERYYLIRVVPRNVPSSASLCRRRSNDTRVGGSSTPSPAPARHLSPSPALSGKTSPRRDPLRPPPLATSTPTTVRSRARYRRGSADELKSRPRYSRRRVVAHTPPHPLAIRTAPTMRATPHDDCIARPLVISVHHVHTRTHDVVLHRNAARRVLSAHCATPHPLAPTSAHHDANARTSRPPALSVTPLLAHSRHLRNSRKNESPLLSSPQVVTRAPLLMTLPTFAPNLPRARNPYTRTALPLSLKFGLPYALPPFPPWDAYAPKIVLVAAYALSALGSTAYIAPVPAEEKVAHGVTAGAHRKPPREYLHRNASACRCVAVSIWTLALAAWRVGLVLRIYTHKDRRKSAPALDALHACRLFKAELGAKGERWALSKAAAEKVRRG